MSKHNLQLFRETPSLAGSMFYDKIPHKIEFDQNVDTFLEKILKENSSAKLYTLLMSFNAPKILNSMYMMLKKF